MKDFNADFYVTAATVIPVLYLALAVQGSTFDAMSKWLYGVIAPAAGQCSAAYRYRGLAPQPGAGLPARSTCAPLRAASSEALTDQQEPRQVGRRCPWHRRGTRDTGGRRTQGRTLPYHVSTTIFPATRPSSMAVWAPTI